MSERVSGYLLLVSGLLSMFLLSYNLYQVFTRQVAPLHYFDLPPVALNTSAFLPPDLELGTSPAPSLELLSGQTMSELANLTLHLILVSFFTGVSYKVASLGIQLLRPIQVKLRATSPPSE